MNRPEICPSCGLEFSRNSSDELCPRCLLGVGLQAATELPNESDAKTRPPTSTSNSASEVSTKIGYFGDYELLEEIARGGMGIVYKARQTSLNRIVALKMILAGQLAGEHNVKRFHAEAEAAAQLDHPGIVPIYEIGEYEGQHFFSMSFVDGCSLADRLIDGPLPPREAAELIGKISETIAFAHKQGVIHRDLKPGNVLLDRNGEPKVTDFGLAKRVQSDSDLTATGQILGTPGYMPPEQASGDTASITPSADVYALGAILYALLTGRPPFQADNPIDVVKQVLEREPISPRLLAPTLNRDLETICLKCLEKRVFSRYQSATELGADVGRFLRGEPIQARPVARPVRVWRWCVRNPWPTAVGGVLILLLMSVSFFALTLRHNLWQGMIDQAQVERLAGRRGRSMELIEQAAEMRRDYSLRREAIQTIVTPGVHLIHKLNFGDASYARFSHDGTFLGVAGTNTLLQKTPFLRVWDATTGKLAGQVDCDEGHGLFIPPVGHQSGAIVKDGDVHFWQHESSTLKLGPQSAGPMLLSPNGQLVAFGSGQVTKLWDLNDEQEVRASCTGNLVGFISNSELLIQVDGQLERWDFESDQITASWTNSDHFEIVREGDVVQFLIECQALESGGTELRDLVSQEVIGVLPNVGAPVDRVCVSPTGSLVAIRDPTAPMTIKVFDVGAGDVQAVLYDINPDNDLENAQFSPNDAFFMVPDEQGGSRVVKVWSTMTGDKLAALPDNHSPVWSRDSRHLATIGAGVIPHPDTRSLGFMKITSSHDGPNAVVNVWGMTSGVFTYRVTGKVDMLSFGSNGTRLAVENSLWSFERGGKRTSMTSSMSSNPRYIKFDRTGRLWMSNFHPGHRGDFQVWREGESPLTITSSNSQKILHIAFSPDGDHLAVATKGKVRLWNLQKEDQIASWKPSVERFSGLVFTPDGSGLAFLCDAVQGAVILDAQTGRQRQQFQYGGRTWSSSPTCLVFQDGFVFAGTANGTVHAHDVESGRERWKSKPAGQHSDNGETTCIAVSDDGRLLVSGGEDGSVRLWDSVKGKHLADWLAHDESSPVLFLDLGRDGEHTSTAAASMTDTDSKAPAVLPRTKAGQPSARCSNASSQNHGCLGQVLRKDVDGNARSFEPV